MEPQTVGVNLVLVSNSDETDLLTALNTNTIPDGSSGKMRTPSLPVPVTSLVQSNTNLTKRMIHHYCSRNFTVLFGDSSNNFLQDNFYKIMI